MPDMSGSKLWPARGRPGRMDFAIFASFARCVWEHADKEIDDVRDGRILDDQRFAVAVVYAIILSRLDFSNKNQSPWTMAKFNCRHSGV